MALRLNGSTSGYVEIDAPAVAGSNTLTLPDGNGTSGQVLSTNGSGALSFVDRMTAAGPAFSAYQNSAQSVSSGTTVKVQFQAEDFDTANCFDSTTNYRFTPNVAGYYQVNALVQQNTGSVEHALFAYKNGSNYKCINVILVPTGRGITGSILVPMNGTTDYLELYFFSSNTASLIPNNTWITAHFARPL